MSRDYAKLAASLLEHAPGFLPWYASTIPKGSLHWECDDFATNGVSPDGRVLFRLPMYSTVLHCGAELVVVLQIWQPGRAVIVAFEFDASTPECPFPMEKIVTPQSLARTRWTIEFETRGHNRSLRVAPLGESALRDVIVFPGPGPAPDDPHIKGRASPVMSIYMWSPRSGHIQIIPLPWFNSQTVDTGYEWITRCAIDPGTGFIFGDGIRVGPFAVDMQGTLVWDRWRER